MSATVITFPHTAEPTPSPRRERRLTRRQMRDVGFDAIPAFKDAHAVLKHHEGRFNFLDSMARVGSLVLGKTKTELIEQAARDRDTTLYMAENLGEAVEEAKLILTIVEVAQFRVKAVLASAMNKGE
jgi:hypothetical protein